MNITFEQIKTEKVTVDIQDGFYKYDNLSHWVFKVKGEHIMLVKLYPNTNDGLYCNTSIEFVQLNQFASFHYAKCIKCTEEDFKKVFNAAMQQVEDILL